MPDDLERTVLAECPETIAAAVAAGSDAAGAVDSPCRDPGRLRAAIERALERRSLPEPLVGALSVAAGALGTPIRGEPVPAPPYLAVTSRGPVCRATLADGRRLLVRVELFAVERRPREYRFRDPSPETALNVALTAPDS